MAKKKTGTLLDYTKPLIEDLTKCLSQPDNGSIVKCIEKTIEEHVKPDDDEKFVPFSQEGPSNVEPRSKEDRETMDKIGD